MQADASLVDLGKWASLGVQLIGYFPLSSTIPSGPSHITDRSTPATTTSSKTFRFTWSGSILPYFSCILTCASFTWCLVYFWRYKEFKSFIEFKAPTEVAAYNLMIITSTLSGIYMKIFGLVNGKKYYEFWEHTKLLFNKFQYDSLRVSQLTTSDTYINSLAGFHKLRYSCKWDFLLVLIPVVIHVSSVYGWSTLMSFLKSVSSFSLSSNDSITSTELYLGLGFWTLGALLHAFNGNWMNFYVKIYTECLHQISLDLKHLKNLQINQKQPSPHIINEKQEGYSINFHQIYSHQPPTHYKSDSSRDIVGLYEKRRANLDVNLKRTLDKLTLVDHEISRFNDFFGKHLLIEVANCVLNLLTFSFFACLWMGRGKWNAFAETLVPLYIYGKELLDMGTVAEELTAGSEEVLNALAEDVMLGDLSEELYLKVQITTMQLCTKPPIVSANQFFSINRSLVTSVMSALATFLVVLVQFRDQDDEDAKELMVASTSTNKSFAATPSTITSNATVPLPFQPQN